MPFGQTINAGLLSPDYSAIERAGQARGMGYQAVGQGIASSLESFGDMKKQQREMEKTIKQSELYIDAAMKLFPEMGPSLEQAKMQIYDVNAPLSDRFAVAESVQGLLNMGMQRMKYDSEQMDAFRAERVKMAELAAKPPEIRDFNRSDGSVVTGRYNPNDGEYYDMQGNKITNMGGSGSSGVQGVPNDPRVPQLPQAQEDAINRAMQGFETGGDTGVLPSRPINGVERIEGVADNGEIIVVQPDGQVAQTDPQTVAQHISGELQSRGMSAGDADDQAAQFIADTIKMGQQQMEQQPPVVGIKQPEGKEGELVTEEKLNQWRAAGLKFNAVPVGGGKYRAENISPASGGEEMEITTNPDGTVSYRLTKGGKLDKQAAVEQAQKDLDAATAKPLFGEAARVISELNKQPQGNTIVERTMRSASANVPGVETEMKAIQKRIQTVKATVSFGYLTKLRAASPTGGALGSVSDVENKKLESVMGSLDAALPPPEVKAKLREIVKMQAEAMYGKDSELDRAVKEGKLTKDEATKLKEDREEAYLNAASGNVSFFESPEPQAAPQTPRPSVPSAMPDTQSAIDFWKNKMGGQ